MKIYLFFELFMLIYLCVYVYYSFIFIFILRCYWIDVELLGIMEIEMGVMID